MAQLLTQEFCFKNVFETFFFKNLILPGERRINYKTKRKKGTCGPIIDPTEGQNVANY